MISHERQSNIIFLSITLGVLLSLSAIYSGVGQAMADSVIATIPVGRYPEGIAFDSSNGNLYVDNFEDNTVSAISGQTNNVIGNPISVTPRPIGIAFNSNKGDLYVTDNEVSSGFGAVSVISSETNTLIDTIPVGFGPVGIAFDSANGNLYVAEQDDSVKVISGQTNMVIATIPVLEFPSAIAFDSSNGNLYVDNSGVNSVSAISGQTNSVIGNPIPVGDNPQGIAFDPASGNLYVTNLGGTSNIVSVISGQTNSVIDSISVGMGPVGIAGDYSNGNLYVANSDDSTVSVISGETNKVIATIPVGQAPSGVAYDSANSDVYITNRDSNTVSVISTVPQAPPQTTITSAVDGNGNPVQNGGSTYSASISFSWTTTGGVAPYSYMCTLDGAPSSSCVSPVTFTNLSPRLHRFSVQATDANHVTDLPARFGWTVVSNTPPPPPPVTPIQATQQLIQLKHSMHLAAATDQVLDARLNSAIQSFQNNIKSGACGHLNGFATDVHAFLQVGRLTQTQASQLLQGLQSVERVAAC